jgi:hypothetical protein
VLTAVFKDDNALTADCVIGIICCQQIVLGDCVFTEFCVTRLCFDRRLS